MLGQAGVGTDENRPRQIQASVNNRFVSISNGAATDGQNIFAWGFTAAGVRRITV